MLVVDVVVLGEGGNARELAVVFGAQLGVPVDLWHQRVVIISFFKCVAERFNLVVDVYLIQNALFLCHLMQKHPGFSRAFQQLEVL